MKPTRPAVEGWFRAGDAPALLGRVASKVAAPSSPPLLRPPPTRTRHLKIVSPSSSRTGTVWSWSTNHYAPPAPYVAPDPFVPYTVVAVELAAEQMVVMGLLDEGVDPAVLHAGLEVELVVGTLFEDEEAIHQIWKWRPTNVGGAA